VYANSFIISDTNKINTKRVAIVTSSLGVGLTASYYYIQNSWWTEKQTDFHFDKGSDLTYALNVDKLGHFMGGIQASDIFRSSMNWAGIQKEKTFLYGAIFGTGIQLIIEMKDAYAPYWGFSVWDLGFGTAGSFFPLLKTKHKFLKTIDFKMSYYKRSNAYWELEAQRGKNINQYAWQDDYVNQTYWMVFDVNEYVKDGFWPKWLNIAIGFGIDDTQYLSSNNTKLGGNNEWYIAFDYDIPKIFKRFDSPIAKKIKYWINYIHFPAPTIKLSPHIEFLPVFL
tara:strand:- start:25 stop:870 length:846 start_codon:yes stop_codon:yes gene_type:complete